MILFTEGDVWQYFQIIDNPVALSLNKPQHRL